MTDSQKEKWLKAGKETIAIEAEALNQLSDRLGDPFVKAVEIIANHSGKVVIVGLGKSGHIGQKVAATLCSTGTPAVFMHAAEASHGDLGIYHPGDPTILISKSGSTAELIHLIPILKEFKSPLISMVGNVDSEIARQSDVILNASVQREADPLGLVPTTSALLTLALGDALACALMKERDFQDKDFARFHPAGQLGRNLLNKVKDVMKDETEVAWISPETGLREVVIAMTRFPEGASCVVDGEKNLLGIITDGDIRRALEKENDFFQLKAADVMVSKPTTVTTESSLADAIKLMEDRPSQISVLPVLTEKEGPCCGLLRLHDAYQPQW